MKRLCLISLGCEKNLVDSENILGMFDELKFTITTEPNDADIIVINTCGFVLDARKEALEMICSCLEYKKNGVKIVVCGCLVQRYQKELSEVIEEVDLWVPIRDYHIFGKLLSSLYQDESYSSYCVTRSKRIISTPPHLAYLKISEGCNNCCTYCAIPLIRGSFVSFKVEDLVLEFRYLISKGAYEICLISQDLTKYGSDLVNTNLVTLLKELLKVKGNYRIRLLYLYPDEITDELIDFVKDNHIIYPYFDIPIQHGTDKILKLMNRRGDTAYIKSLVSKIREKIPHSIIRTTIIVGFPYETNKNFQELIAFIKEVEFDRLGVFTYSREEDTPSYIMNSQVSEEVKSQRKEKLLDVQEEISFRRNQKYVGLVYECIVEGEEENYYVARNYAYAPDDIDGCIVIEKTNNLVLELGSIVLVKIVEAEPYDLVGVV